MRILFLGTGAADWKLDLHKEIKGFRRNASLLIDDCFLIDPGPHVLDALQSYSKKADAIKYIINTHPHADHYNKNTVSQLTQAKFYPMHAGETHIVGNYTVTALKANHSTCEGAVHFIISDGKKKLFYGLDGAWLLYEEVSAIKNTTIDFAVFDATVGNAPGNYRIFEHNNLNMVLEMKSSLENYIQRFCISHMARTLHNTHEELQAQMKHHGIEVAFDGYETEI